MKKLIAAIAAVSACLLFSGCATTMTPAQALAQAQSDVAAVCPALNAGVTLFQAEPLPVDATKALNDVAPLVKSTCTAIPTVTTSTPAQLVNTVFPAFTLIINSAPNVTQAKKDEITTAINIAQAALSLLLNYLPTTTAAPAVPASATLVAAS